MNEEGQFGKEACFAYLCAMMVNLHNAKGTAKGELALLIDEIQGVITELMPEYSMTAGKEPVEGAMSIEESQPQ